MEDIISIGKTQTFRHTTNNDIAKIDKLEEALAATSTRNKTVIISFVNKAYVEGNKTTMLDVFLYGFSNGEGTRELMKHLLIVAMDGASYKRCRSLRLHCYKLETQGVDFEGEKVYMSEEFIRMMWRRTLFLGEVLQRGYNFIFTDMDVLWLRNPFPYLTTTEPELDLQISTDKYRSAYPRVNTGFYMIRSNNKTRALFHAWYARKDTSPGLKEQDVLQALMLRGVFRRLSLTVKFLDTLYFSGFCQDSRDPAAVATVHANCCRGMAAKLTDLTAVLRDWKRYNVNDKMTPFRWSSHSACRKSFG
ncbi:uncharacterized protein At1g28695-like [Andrographis paniculata]|uniref:uncharacterized protein At1g28695-like n=1 Tax=Andrographis paniculata TaxID=175694 RepID=UPI0021E91475|nr:uncharacterized protein At1g28695-like [Andrographis paniculata]